MKTLVIYTSQTGFTQKYAQWIAEKTNADLMELKDAKKKDPGFFDTYEAIVYGGWMMAEKVTGISWFLGHAPLWKGKRLAVFATGAGPNANPELDTVLEKILNAEQKKYIRVFYCQGGLNYDRMKLPYRMMMKMYVSAMSKKKNATEDEKKKAAMIAESYDVADIQYAEPVAAYLTDKTDG